MNTEQLLSEALLEIKSIKSQLNEMRSIIEGNQVASSGWVDCKNAIASLKFDGVQSQSHLKQLRLKGVLSEKNNCVRNISKGDRPTWQYNIQACRKALKSHFSKLA